MTWLVPEYQKLDSYIKNLDISLMDSTKREHYMENFVDEYYANFGMKNIPKDSFRGFKHNGPHIGGEWRGFIPYEGKHKGASISLFEGEPFIVRGFPQFEPTNESIIFTNSYPYVDGARIQMFTFPSGIVHGKSDDIELLFRTAQNTVNYRAYVESCVDGQQLIDMVKTLGENYAFNIILYGRDLSAYNHPFYNIDAGYVILSIENRTTHEILNHDRCLEICEEFGVKHISHASVPQRMSVLYDRGDMFVYVNPSLFKDKGYNTYRAAVRDSWQAQCNNSYPSHKFDLALEKIAEFYNDPSLLMKRNDILQESIEVGKKVSLDWYVPWVLDKYGLDIKDLTPEEILKKIDTRFSWGAWDDKYGKETLIEKIQEWLNTTDFSKFENMKHPKWERFVGLRFVQEGNLDNPTWLKGENKIGFIKNFKQ